MQLKGQKVFIALLVILIVIELCWCQTTSKSKKRRKPNRNRKKHKDGEDNRIKCYSCYVDFSDFRISKFNAKNLCYNPNINKTLTDTLLLTQCSPVTKFCTVDITRVNNVLAIIDRRCGLSTCREYCLSKGYGVDRETCTYCCPGKLTEDDDDYDPDESDNYHCPIGPH